MRMPKLAPQRVTALTLTDRDRRIAHMAASLLLD